MMFDMDILWILLLVFLLQDFVSASGKCTAAKGTCSTTTKKPKPTKSTKTASTTPRTAITSTTKTSSASRSTTTATTTTRAATTSTKKTSSTFRSITTTSATTTTATTSAIKTSTTSPTTAATVSKVSDRRSEISQTIYISIPVIVIIIATIAGLVLGLKRRGFGLSVTRIICRRNTSTQKHNIGTAITNTTYDNTDLSQTEESPTSHPMDNEYAEILSNNLAENPDSEYQTIDGLPENQTTSASTYEHLNAKGGGYDSNTYSHIGENQSEAVTGNLNYAHIGKVGHKSHEAVSEASIDSTYNRLDTISRLNKGRNANEIKHVEDDETEYDHAITGRTDSVSDSKALSEYAHLKTTTRGICTIDRALNRADNVMAVSDSDEPGKPIIVADNVVTSTYSEAYKNSTNASCSYQTIPNTDGYQLADGSLHHYFTLEPDRDPQRNNVAGNESVTEHEVSECEESQSHEYFILEAQ